MKWEIAKQSAKNMGNDMQMIHYLQGTKLDKEGRVYLSRGSHLLQLWRGPAEVNSEGGKWEGLSEAWNAQERSLSHKGNSQIALEVGWLVNCGEDVGKCVGFADFVRQALSGNGDVVRQSGRRVSVVEVVEDAKVLQRGRGVSAAGQWRDR